MDLNNWNKASVRLKLFYASTKKMDDEWKKMDHVTNLLFWKYKFRMASMYTWLGQNDLNGDHVTPTTCACVLL